MRKKYKADIELDDQLALFFFLIYIYIIYN
jgi:hypothetical protein